MNRIGKQLTDLILTAIQPPRLLVLPDPKSLGLLSEAEAMNRGGITIQALRQLRCWRCQDGTKFYFRDDLDALTNQKRK